MKQVPFSRSSLNHDDVFVLDTESKIYQFNGATSNIQERAKALDVVQYIKDKYHEGKCDVAVIEDGKLGSEVESGSFGLSSVVLLQLVRRVTMKMIYSWSQFLESFTLLLMGS